MHVSFISITAFKQCVCRQQNLDQRKYEADEKWGCMYKRGKLIINA